jgi:tetratricopeptide (TPR) repeat protein
LRVALGCVLIATPLALGGAHPQVNVVVAGTLVVVLAVWLASRKNDQRPTSTLPVVIVGAALAATLMQLVPLPMSLIKAIAPGTHAVLSMSLDAATTWAPLSLDLPATAHEVLKLVAYLAGSILAVNVFGDHRRHRRQLLGFISAAGFAVVTMGFIHQLAGLDRPYGLFGYVTGSFTSSFINANHLAGFLGFCSIVALGLALSADDGWRLVHAGNSALCGAGVFLSLSRGGSLSFVAALIFLGGVLALNRSERFRKIAWVQLALAGALVVAGYIAYTQFVHEMWTLSGPNAFSKTEVWRPVPQILGDFPVLGVGRGAFGWAYARYTAETGAVMFTHLENEVLQTLVDWGALVGSLLLIAMVVALARALMNATGSPTRTAAVAALLFLVVDNLGDFNLTLSAVALPALMLLASLKVVGSWHGQHEERQEEDTSPRKETSPSGRLQWVGVAILVVVTMACGWLSLAHEINRDTLQLRALLERRNAITDERKVFAGAVVHYHPADAVLPLLVAEHDLRLKNGATAALRLANKGMFLSPRMPVGHVLAARALTKLGHADQALIEYRLACDLDSTRAMAIITEVFGSTHDLGHVAQLANADINVRLQVARFLLNQQAPVAALAVLDAPISLETVEATQIATEALLSQGMNDEAVARLVRAEKGSPRTAQLLLLRAQVLRRVGKPAEALAILLEGIKSLGDPATLWEPTINLLIETGRVDDARMLARQQIENTPVGPTKARAHWSLGTIYARENQRAPALREYQKARDIEPTNIGYRIGIAALRESMGDLKGARVELEAARAYGTSSTGVEETLKRIEARIAAGDEALRRDQFLPPGK